MYAALLIVPAAITHYCECVHCTRCPLRRRLGRPLFAPLRHLPVPRARYPRCRTATTDSYRWCCAKRVRAGAALIVIARIVDVVIPSSGTPVPLLLPACATTNSMFCHTDVPQPKPLCPSHTPPRTATHHHTTKPPHRTTASPDIDCGGLCAACPTGSRCESGSDCQSNDCSPSSSPLGPRVCGSPSPTLAPTAAPTLAHPCDATPVRHRCVCGCVGVCSGYRAVCAASCAVVGVVPKLHCLCVSL